MLRVESQGSRMQVILNRPEVRNAFNDEVIAELTKTFSDIPAHIRVIELSGEGKAFCAGGDLEWMKKASSYSEAENIRDAVKLAGLFQSIATCKALVIAKVHGAAFGGGCGLVAAADIAIASPDALFAFSEVRLGLIPATISTFVIPKIGAGHARALFATGEAFNADHAFRIGLVHAVGDIEELAEAKVKQILSIGPSSAYESKRLVFDYPLEPEEAATRLALARAGDEGKEGVAAFLERRKPSFFEEITN